MKTIVKVRNLDAVDDRLRAYIERKIGRLDRIAHPQAEAIVEIRAHESRSADAANVADVTLLLNGQVLHSVASAATPRAAFDMVLDKLERQVVRHNEKPRVREKSPAEVQVIDQVARGAIEPDRAAPAVVKVKRFDMEPMFEEDALARMEELGHSFFVFLNAESGGVCVLYRRTDGNFGLIEPVVPGVDARLSR